MFAHFVQNAILLAADFTAGLLARDLVQAHLPFVFQPLDGLAIPWKLIALHAVWFLDFVGRASQQIEPNSLIRFVSPGFF
jgi:hypothetical protein